MHILYTVYTGCTYIHMHIYIHTVHTFIMHKKYLFTLLQKICINNMHKNRINIHTCMYKQYNKYVEVNCQSVLVISRQNSHIYDIITTRSRLHCSIQNKMKTTFPPPHRCHLWALLDLTVFDSFCLDKSKCQHCTRQAF